MKIISWILWIILLIGVEAGKFGSFWFEGTPLGVEIEVGTTSLEEFAKILHREGLEKLGIYLLENY